MFAKRKKKEKRGVREGIKNRSVKDSGKMEEVELQRPRFMDFSTAWQDTAADKPLFTCQDRPQKVLLNAVVDLLPSPPPPYPAESTL